MKLKAFDSINTRQDLDNMVALLNSVADEHNIDSRKLFVVEDLPYKDCVYALSTIRNDLPVRHFFVYRGVVPHTVGLLGLNQGDSATFEIAKPDYVNYDYLHNRVFLATKSDSTADLIVDCKPVATKILSHDVIDINGLHFVQLDFSDSRGLICCDSQDPFEGLFIPKNKADFKKYFEKVLFLRGSEGFFDDYSVSGVINCYFEVINFIFETKYRRIEL